MEYAKMEADKLLSFFASDIPAAKYKTDELDHGWVCIKYKACNFVLLEPRDQ